MMGLFLGFFMVIVNLFSWTIYPGGLVIGVPTSK